MLNLVSVLFLGIYGEETNPSHNTWCLNCFWGRGRECMDQKLNLSVNLNESTYLHTLLQDPNPPFLITGSPFSIHILIYDKKTCRFASSPTDYILSQKLMTT
jgi:hypothetical protein